MADGINQRELEVAAQIMSHEELQAVEFADTYYGALAKLEATKFMESIGAIEESSLALKGIAHSLDSLDFTEKHAVAENFRALRGLLGGAAVAQPVQLVPVTESESSLPRNAVMLGDSQAESTKLDEATAHKFNSLQLRFVGDLFGEMHIETVKQFTTDQVSQLLEAFGNRYVNLSITRLNAQAKADRCAIMIDYVLRGITAHELGKERGVSASAISAGTRKMIESARKRLEQQDFDDMVQSVTQGAGHVAVP